MPIVTATGLHAEAKPLLPVHRFQRVGLIRLLGAEAHDDGQEQAAKEFAAIITGAIPEKSGAWYRRITTERMIFITTSASLLIPPKLLFG